MKKNKKCFWCGSETPKTKKGWLLYSFTHHQVPDIDFCSKECLAAATVDGKGTCLDANKLAAKQSRITRKKKIDTLSNLTQKEKLCNEDLAQLYGCLNAKQRKFLAVVGLANISWMVHGVPKQIMAKIIDGAKEL